MPRSWHAVSKVRLVGSRQLSGRLPGTFWLHIALEEADESVLWLELLDEGGHLPEGRLDDMLLEARAILAILSKAEKTARDKQRKNMG